MQQDTSSSSEDSEDNIPLSILVAQAQANIASIWLDERTSEKVCYLFKKDNLLTYFVSDTAQSPESQAFDLASKSSVNNAMFDLNLSTVNSHSFLF